MRHKIYIYFYWERCSLNFIYQSPEKKSVSTKILISTTIFYADKKCFFLKQQIS